MKEPGCRIAIRAWQQCAAAVPAAAPQDSAARHRYRGSRAPAPAVSPLPPPLPVPAPVVPPPPPPPVQVALALGTTTVMAVTSRFGTASELVLQAVADKSWFRQHPTQLPLQLLMSLLHEDRVSDVTSDSPLTNECNASSMLCPSSRAIVHHTPAQAAAISASNVMMLLSDAGYRAQINAQLLHGVPLNKRDALDSAGAQVAAMKSRAIGISADELVIDPAQAGGLLGKFDGMFADGSWIEVKAARSYHCDRSFQFSLLQQDSLFEHLFLIGRSADPVDWTDVHELEALCWLGYVSRAGFDTAVARLQRSGRQAGATECRLGSSTLRGGGCKLGRLSCGLL
eukprot:3354974-Rhodomonas_salina.1